MANVRIGPDGSIIKDDVVVEPEGRTIIHEDGTIETTNVGDRVTATPPPMVAVPPISPLERNGSANTISSVGGVSSGNSPQGGSVDLKAIKEKEYDIQIIDGRIKNSIPTGMIVATVILCILGAIGLYFLFIPAVITGIFVIIGFIKKGELETERARMCEELEALKRGSSQ